MKATFIILSLIILTSCARPITKELDAPINRFSLNLEEEKTIEGFQITFTEVNDTRCPEEVACEVPGSIAMHVEVRKSGQLIASQLFQEGFRETPINSLSWFDEEANPGFGYNLLLSSFLPAHREETNKEDYQVTLVLRHVNLANIDTPFSTRWQDDPVLVIPDTILVEMSDWQDNRCVDIPCNSPGQFTTELRLNSNQGVIGEKSLRDAKRRNVYSDFIPFENNGKHYALTFVNVSPQNESGSITLVLNRRHDIAIKTDTAIQEGETVYVHPGNFPLTLSKIDENCSGACLTFVSDDESRTCKIKNQPRAHLYCASFQAGDHTNYTILVKEISSDGAVIYIEEVLFTGLGEEMEAYVGDGVVLTFLDRELYFSSIDDNSCADDSCADWPQYIFLRFFFGEGIYISGRYGVTGTVVDQFFENMTLTVGGDTYAITPLEITPAYTGQNQDYKLQFRVDEIE
jgi:hypothetical protein